jgi:hypothetical protein
MEYSVNPDYGYTVAIGDIRVHVVSYEVSRERKYKLQHVTKGQTAVGDAGVYPVYLTLKGRILRTENSRTESTFYDDMEKGKKYFVRLDRVYFNSARLEKFTTVTDMSNQYIDCELKFMCDSTMGSVIE